MLLKTGEETCVYVLLIKVIDVITEVYTTFVVVEGPYAKSLHSDQ